MTGLAMNLAFAKEAIAHVKRKVPRGSGNQSYSEADSNACITMLRQSMVSTTNYVPHLAHRAIQMGCGNCAEQAAVAHEFLKAKGVRPLDYMDLNDPGGRPIHVFVVIGFEGDSGDSSGWGESCVICDPWDEAQAYPAWKIAHNMSLWESASSVESEFRLD